MKPDQVESAEALAGATKLNVSQGDTVVITIDRPLTTEQAARAEAYATARLPAGVRVLVLERSSRVEVVSSCPDPSPLFEQILLELKAIHGLLDRRGDVPLLTLESLPGRQQCP